MKPKASHKATTGQNVISMSGYKSETRFPQIKQIEAYWEGLRMGRMVPQRSEVDPRGIERALEYTFVLERIAPGLARFRLSGLHLNDLLGMEVRGMPFTSFFTPAARQTIMDTLEAVFDGPQTAELTLAGERSIGKPVLDAKLILLPLRSDLGEITRIMGCLVSSGPIGRAPRRFDVTGRKMKTLTAGHRPVPEAPKPTMSPLVAGFSEPVAPFATACDDVQDPSTGKRPNLRLVKTDT